MARLTHDLTAPHRFQSSKATLQKTRKPSSYLAEGNLHYLQCTVGNRATQKTLCPRDDDQQRKPQSQAAVQQTERGFGVTERNLATKVRATNSLIAQRRNDADFVHQVDRNDGRNKENWTDPNFLVCFVMCELGISIENIPLIIHLFLEAVSKEYEHLRAVVQSRKDVKAIGDVFEFAEPIDTLELLLEFVVHGELLSIEVRSPAALAIRSRMRALLLAFGATEAGLIVAEQIVRRIALAIELAMAAGCGIYCGAQHVRQLIDEFAGAFADALAVADGAPGQILEQVFARPILLARVTLDPSNWDLGGLPLQTRADLSIVGLYLWSVLAPENPKMFLERIARPLSAYSLPIELVTAISGGLSQAASKQTGFQIEFTPETLLGLTPMALVHMLSNWNLLVFRMPPERVVDELLVQQSGGQKE